ncbi:MAG: NADH/ubiquinone/plastoquinone (complex I) [Gammaproteobacteria bacterium]|nr:NADH/ubiquinone/plastoquinone (complex I) [Gammaproteobacteria bacterium]NNJ79547.1 NADH/ubiquinone/plastoquinone (complex I) [Xanthomonadales bacterium]
MDISVHALIPYFIALPLTVSILVQLLARRRDGLAAGLAGLCMLVMATLSLLAALSGQGGEVIYNMGGWATPIGIDLRLDALTALLLLTVNTVALAVALYAADYMKSFTAVPRFYSLFLLMVTGMNGVVMTGDLFNLYVFLEISAIASYALVAFGCEREELEASFKYIVLGSVSSSLILIALALMYGVTGALNMAHVSARVAEVGLDAPLTLAFALFLCGFAFKAALVPFHAWLPDAHPAAPAPVSALLSGVLIKAVGIYVLARLVFNVFGPVAGVLELLCWLGLASMLVGGLAAMGQNDIKRMFAYSSISQVGFIVLGLGLATPLGLVGALYHLVNHALFKSLLFLNAGAVERCTGTRNLDELGGLNRALPVTGATSLVGSMSIAGIPPLNGFWSKLIIILACVQAGRYGFATVAVVVSIVTLAYQLKVQHRAFFAALPEALGTVRREPRRMALAMILLAAGCVVLSFAVVTGFTDPVFIGDAQAVLSSGTFGAQP